MARVVEFRGTEEECNAYVADMCRRYHPAGYGTWFNWPMGTKKGFDGKPVTHLKATNNGDGTFTVRGTRSDSCD